MFYIYTSIMGLIYSPLTPMRKNRLVYQAEFLELTFATMLNCEGEKGLVTLGSSNHLLRQLSQSISNQNEKGKKGMCQWITQPKTNHKWLLKAPFVSYVSVWQRPMQWWHRGNLTCPFAALLSALNLEVQPAFYLLQYIVISNMKWSDPTQGFHKRKKRPRQLKI